MPRNVTGQQRRSSRSRLPVAPAGVVQTTVLSGLSGAMVRSLSRSIRGRKNGSSLCVSSRSTMNGAVVRFASSNSGRLPIASAASRTESDGSRYESTWRFLRDEDHLLAVELLNGDLGDRDLSNDAQAAR